MVVPAMSCIDIEAAMVAAVRKTRFDHSVLVAAGLSHPPEVTVADPIRAGSMVRTTPIQTVS